MSWAGRKRRQSLRLICEINVTAFLSIQLALLAMFMALPMSYHDLPKGPSTDLAKVAHPVSMRAADREDAMVVAVMRTGDIFFLGDKILPDQLDFKIRKQLEAGSEKKVYIKADARAKYGRVRQVLEAVQSSGVERVGFLVTQRETKTLP
jgi:biopolymer transport protein ExbD/biopolymer transport protein TolR